MVRGPTYDENGMKKGAWSKEEDDKLRTYILKYGHWNWRELPKFAGLSRCGKSCRLRWMNYLRPNLKHGNYTKEEEDIIIKLREQHGNKWSLIASKLPGRPDNEIKNYWHTRLKMRKKNDRTSDGMQEHSSETSQWEANQIGEAESQMIPSHTPILVSSPLSASTSTCEFSSSSFDHTLSYGVNQLTEDSIALSEAFEYGSGDFWSQPFVSDNAHSPHCYSSSLSNGGFALPYGSYYDDNLDLYHQVMSDLEEIDYS